MERLHDKKAPAPFDEMTESELAHVEELLERWEYQIWFDREIQPALDSLDRGEGAPLKSREAFMARMGQRRQID